VCQLLTSAATWAASLCVRDCLALQSLSGAEDGEIELDHGYRVAAGNGESIPGGIEGHRRRLRIPFEAPHNAAVLQARVQLGPHVEHLAGRKVDQFRVSVERKNVVGADRQDCAGRLVELEGAKTRASGEIVDG
jgi:hypothetical protein